MDELNQLLQKKIHGTTTHPNPALDLAKTTADLKSVRFQIFEALEEMFPSYFHDVGAVVYFLKHAPWEIPDFDTAKYHSPLLELHRTITNEGSLKVTSSRFFVEARKPT